MELWGTPCSQTISKKEQRGFTFPNFETYYQTILISRLRWQCLRLGKDQGNSLFHRGLPAPQHFLTLSMLMLASALPSPGDIYYSTLLWRKNEMDTEKWARWWRRAGISALWDFPLLHSKDYCYGVGGCNNQKGPLDIKVRSTPFYRQGDWGLEMGSESLKVT